MNASTVSRYKLLSIVASSLVLIACSTNAFVGSWSCGRVVVEHDLFTVHAANSIEYFETERFLSRIDYEFDFGAVGSFSTTVLIPGTYSVADAVLTEVAEELDVLHYETDMGMPLDEIHPQLLMMHPTGEATDYAFNFPNHDELQVTSVDDGEGYLCSRVDK